MRRARPGERLRGAPSTAAAWLLAVLLPSIGCNEEHYQFLPDGWEDDAAAEGFDGVVEADGEPEGVDDVPDADGVEDGDATLSCGPAEDGGDGAASCPGGLACCGHEEELRCVDLDTDPGNCGACGEGCGEGAVCDGGECGCPAGLVNCDGDCVSVADDPDHCGRCDLACDDGFVCVSGICEPT